MVSFNNGQFMNGVQDSTGSRSSRRDWHFVVASGINQGPAAAKNLTSEAQAGVEARPRAGTPGSASIAFGALSIGGKITEIGPMLSSFTVQLFIDGMKEYELQPQLRSDPANTT